MYVINYKVQFTTRFLELESFSILWGLLLYIYTYILIYMVPQLQESTLLLNLYKGAELGICR